MRIATLVYAHSILQAWRRAIRQRNVKLGAADCRTVRGRTGPRPHVAVHLERSGRPKILARSDIYDFCAAEADGQFEAAVIVPAGFSCDHIEVLYDLDTEAAAVCAEIGLPMVRARAVNDHPLFLDMMADVVQETLRRYSNGRPLPVAMPRA